MRAGVITFHSAHNYGATLQTWALQKALKKVGAEPCVIHYHPESIDRLYRPTKIKNAADIWKYLTKKSFRVRIRRMKKKYEKYTTFLNQNLKLVGDYRTYEELQAAPPELDCYITGSDQVWNTDHTGGFDPAYLLEFAPAGKRKISYAASVGRERFLPQYRESFANSLRSFDELSVREESAQCGVSEAAEKPVSVVMDPTFLLSREEYDEIKVPIKRKERYILVYMMENNKSMIELANNISATTGLPIIQRKLNPIFRNEIESFYTHTPGEFLGEIEQAEYVITNSFHGTVFSIIYQRPFISMLHSETGSRTIDLLKSLGLESHILEKTKTFRSMSRFSIDEPDALRLRIESLRISSLAYLKQAVTGEVTERMETQDAQGSETAEV